MVKPPEELDGARVLKFALVTSEVQPTGSTLHIVGDESFGPAASLAIARYPKEEGTYLFYLDSDGRVVTDTWHRSLDDALHQAALEYEGLRWTDVADA